MSHNAQLEAEAAAFQGEMVRIFDEVGKFIVGQRRVVECAVTALISGGNILLEGVPGLGKTMLIKVLGGALDLKFNRVQFTPDLMPADIIGTNILSNDGAGNYQVEFRKGPVFTQLLLADEINRATPKTQSALLESMQEGSVTVAGITYKLDPPFFVMATQNPLEQEGTYPLPEAQLDRFMFKVVVPFLNRDEMNEVLRRTVLGGGVEAQKIFGADRILEMRSILDKVVVAEPIQDYATRLVLATHPESEFASEQVTKFVRWGCSPRAAQALLRAARVRAMSEGRMHLAFEDVRYFAAEVMQHRIILNYDGQAENVSMRSLVDDVLAHIGQEA